jgi:hypothetical protein
LLSSWGFQCELLESIAAGISAGLIGDLNVPTIAAEAETAKPSKRSKKASVAAAAAAASDTRWPFRPLQSLGFFGYIMGKEKIRQALLSMVRSCSFILSDSVSVSVSVCLYFCLPLSLSRTFHTSSPLRRCGDSVRLGYIYIDIFAGSRFV